MIIFPQVHEGLLVLAEESKCNRLCLYDRASGRYLAVRIIQVTGTPGTLWSGIEPTRFQVKSPGHTLIALSNLAVLKELLPPPASFFWKISVPLKPDA